MCSNLLFKLYLKAYCNKQASDTLKDVSLGALIGGVANGIPAAYNNIKNLETIMIGSRLTNHTPPPPSFLRAEALKGVGLRTAKGALLGAALGYVASKLLRKGSASDE